jgi:hypothetical protein
MALVTLSGICSNGAECPACSSLQSLTISPTLEQANIAGSRFYSNGWRITDNPTIERSMININPSFFHNFFEIAIRNAIPDIKENRIKNNVFTNRSWRMDETYIKVKGEWVYLYRAVDSHGDTLDFMLSERRDEEAATAFRIICAVSIPAIVA